MYHPAFPVDAPFVPYSHLSVLTPILFLLGPFLLKKLQKCKSKITPQKKIYKNK